MVTPKVKSLLDRLLSQMGKAELERYLEAALDKREPSNLTIVSNLSLHPLREAHKRGEVFVASTGSFDFSNPEIVKVQFEEALRGVIHKLQERPWKKIYLVPFGPAGLSMQIKLLVYRVLHIETIDVLHLGEETYADIEIHHRSLMNAVRADLENEYLLSSHARKLRMR
jgi:hypothetical protein